MRTLAICSAVALMLGGACQSAPEHHPLMIEAGSVAERSLQTRTFEGRSEIQVQRACISLLQDLGFCVDESEVELGVLLASKQRDARELNQYLLAFLIAGLGYEVPVDVRQRIHASVITFPHGSQPDRIAVRVIFQRIVWDDHKQISKRERLDDPQFYEEFFDLLRKALFLEETAP